MTPARRSCRPCRTSKIGCSRDVPSCQSCIARGRSALCVYEETSQRQSRRQKQWKITPRTQPTRSEESSNHGTETLQDCGQTMQPGIQHVDAEQLPYLDQASVIQESAQPMALLTEKCSPNVTREEVNYSLLPTIANATLPDADWTKAYFAMVPPVKLSTSRHLRNPSLTFYIDRPPIVPPNSTPNF